MTTIAARVPQPAATLPHERDTTETLARASRRFLAPMLGPAHLCTTAKHDAARPQRWAARMCGLMTGSYPLDEYALAVAFEPVGDRAQPLAICADLDGGFGASALDVEVGIDAWGSLRLRDADTAMTARLSATELHVEAGGIVPGGWSAARARAAALWREAWERVA